MSYNRIRRRAALAGATVVTALAVAGAAACGSDGGSRSDSHTPGAATSGATAAPSSSAAASRGRHNDVDIAFAQMMIPHHSQAVQMSELAATRAADPELRQLAAEIVRTQGLETETLFAWLRAWRAPTAAPGAGEEGTHAPGSDHGMVPHAEMDKLVVLKGAEFDRQFAELMIMHHNGAIRMAQDEQKNGANAMARELAAQIIASQQAEVATLRKILDRL